MLLQTLRKIGVLVAITFLVNFISFSYAHISLNAQRSLNPFGVEGNSDAPPILSEYGAYVSSLMKGDPGSLPGAQGKVSDLLFQSAGASFGLLVIAFSLSTLLGLGLGLLAVRSEPPGVRSLLAPFASVGLALPGFFVSAIFLSILVYSLINTPPETKPALPTSGFGWDVHLILPVIALSIRPIAQIAQTSAILLAGELNSQYIIATRAFGATWTRIRRRNALKNVLAQIIMNIASSFRLLVAELILVEFIFNWPGLGRLLARTLIPPATASPGGLGQADIIFLNPPLLAGLMTIFALVFLIADFIASTTAHHIDPRLESSEEKMVANEK